MRDPLILSSQFRDVLDEIEHSDDSYFISGRAGTGKSTLLQLFRKTSKKKTITLAPTGVAALHVRGQTIHSFFGFPPRLINSEEIKKHKKPKWFKSIEAIIIDEISMVRADLLDNIDRSLRLNREDDRLFGGVQVIFFGDLFQLPPVVSSPFEQNYFQTTYSSPYFFSAHAFNNGFNLKHIKLTKVYRQEETNFLSILESIRSYEVDDEVLEVLNSRFVDIPKQGSYITLTAINQSAKQINERKLTGLPGKTKQYSATIRGEFNPGMYPTDQVLNLKEGAQVMFIRNDPLRKFVNGTIGYIKKLTDKQISVVIEGDSKEEEIEVDQFEWEILKYRPGDGTREIRSEVSGSFKQYPLKLAWAITIHKSQGKTFDRVIIDLGRGAFEHGQTYVALSRCRTLNGIILSRPVRYQDILVDERIVDFYQFLGNHF